MTVSMHCSLPLAAHADAVMHHLWGMLHSLCKLQEGDINLNLLNKRIHPITCLAANTFHPKRLGMVSSKPRLLQLTSVMSHRTCLCVCALLLFAEVQELL